MIAQTSQHPALGLVAATTAAFFWSISVVMYRRVGRIMPPVRLNCAKGLCAVVILSAVVGLAWKLTGKPPWSMPTPMVLLMALSGVIGIGIGDSLFFAGLNRMGARRMLLLFTVNPVITAILAWLLIDEPLTLMQIIGVALTCGGVAWVIAERNPGNKANGKTTDGHVDALGIVFGLGAASCQAAGLLMSRYVFEQGEMSSASSAWLRLGAGAAALCLLLPLDRYLSDPGGEDHHHPKHPSKAQATTMFFIALMLGTVGGIWLMQIAVKESGKVGVASTLLSTSPLFILPIAAMLKEHISPRAILGALISVGGIAMLYLASS